MYNCDYGHKSDSAFAIIPLTQTPFGTELETEHLLILMFL